MKQLYLFSADSADMRASSSGTATHWKLYVDGASRNNPGPAGAGIVLYKGDTLFEKHGFFLGTRTNNQAEYAALLLGLFLIKKHIAARDHLLVVSDSLLLVKQFHGEYRIKHPELRPLHTLAKKLLEGISVTFTHVLREKNTEADACANEGIDKRIAVPSDFLVFLKHHAISW